MADSRDSLLPGLVVVAAAVGVAFAVHRVVDTVSPLVVAVVVGAVLTNLGLIPDRCRSGMKFATKRLLRAGIVLLGFRLSIRDVLHLGGPSVAVVVGVVALTFLGTQWLGAKVGVSRELSLLVATGFSICGASAIAAMEPISDASEEDVAFSIALVTLCGSVAIAILPPLGRLLDMSPSTFGAWVGASVHDVAQVVATASTAGATALSAAVVVKLTRVALLAPMVAGVSVRRRRHHSGLAVGAAAQRPPIVPLFVVGFLVAAAVRSSAVLPVTWFPNIQQVETVLLAAALVGLGTGVQFTKLRTLGHRPVLLGLASWMVIAVTSFVGVTLTHR